MAINRWAPRVLAAGLVILGALALGALGTATIGLAFVAVLFCDAPGATIGECVRSAAGGIFLMLAPVLLPVGVGALLAGAAIFALLRRQAEKRAAPNP